MSSPLFEHPTVHGAISLALGRRPTRSPERYRKDTPVFARAECNRILQNIRIAEDNIREIKRGMRDVQRDIERLARDVERIEARLSNTDIAQSLLSALSATVQAAATRNPVAAIRALLEAADVLEAIGLHREAGRLTTETVILENRWISLETRLGTEEWTLAAARRALTAHNCGT